MGAILWVRCTYISSAARRRACSFGASGGLHLVAERFEKLPVAGAVAASTEADLAELVAHAYLALYAAKRQGRNRVLPYRAHMADAA